jgi:tetratricopeptide (TPR) repeat protein
MFLLACMLGLPQRASGQGEKLKRSISLMNASRSMEAEQVLRSIGPGDTDYSSAQTYLGFLLLDRAALPQAEEAFRNALSRQPGNAPARLGLGIILIRMGQPAEAGQEFVQVLEDPAVGLDASVHQVESLYFAGQDEEAYRAAKILAEAHPSAPQVQRLMGFLYQVRGETQNALRSYLDCIQLKPEDLAPYFSVIGIYRSLRDWENALRWANRALALDENHPLLYQELAEIYQGLGRSDDARTARLEAERTYEAEILYIRAVGSRIAGRTQEARELLRDCTAKNPRLTKAWIDLGELLQRERRFGDAARAFRSGLEHAPEDPRARLGLVIALRSDGKEAEAERYLADPAGGRSPDLLAALASGLLKQGKVQEAAAAALQAVNQQPDDPDLLFYLGYVQQSGGRDREALVSYAAALRLDPKHVGALAGQAQSRLSQGDARGAIESFRMARELDPANVRILQGLVQAYKKAGDARSAESACRACLSLNPRDTECREQMAFLRMDARDYKEAAKQFERLVQDGAASKNALDALTFALMNTGNYARAIEIATRSLERFGPDARTYSNLGFLSRCVGNLQAAIDAYRRARDLAPADAERYGDLGLAYYLAREYESAVEPLQEAVRLKPGWGAAHYSLALVYWNLKQYEPALNHARIAQNLGVREARSAVSTLAAYLRK